MVLPARCVDAQELVMIGEPNFRQAGSLQLTQRPIGCNTVGVVAWLMLLRTPECPDGRQVCPKAVFTLPMRLFLVCCCTHTAVTSALNTVDAAVAFCQNEMYCLSFGFEPLRYIA